MLYFSEMSAIKFSGYTQRSKRGIVLGSVNRKRLGSVIYDDDSDDHKELSAHGAPNKPTCVIAKISLDSLNSWDDLIKIDKNSLYNIVVEESIEEPKQKSVYWNYDLFTELHPMFTKMRDSILPLIYKQRLLKLTISTLRGVTHSLDMYSTIIIGEKASGKTTCAKLLGRFYKILLKLEITELYGEEDELKSVDKTQNRILIIDTLDINLDLLIKTVSKTLILGTVKYLLIYVSQRSNRANDIPVDLHCEKSFGMVIKLSLPPVDIFRIVLRTQYPSCTFTATDNALIDIFQILENYTIDQSGDNEYYMRTLNFNNVKLLLEECELINVLGSQTTLDPDWLTLEILHKAAKQRDLYIMRKNRERELKPSIYS